MTQYVPGSPDRCINCGEPLILQKPDDCPEHVSAEAARIREQEVPDERRACTNAAGPHVAAKAARIIEAIASEFGIESETLKKPGQSVFERKFARYFALYLARNDEALFAHLGEQLGITSRAAKLEAVRVMKNWLMRENVRGGDIARRMLARFNLQTPA